MPKRASSLPDGATASDAAAAVDKVKRQRKCKTLQEKVELLDLLDELQSYAAVARHYGINESTVRSIKKNESAIRSVAVNVFDKATKLKTVRKKDLAAGGALLLDSSSSSCSYPEAFRHMVDQKGYRPEQVFNMHETSLFWKRMPSRSCLMKADGSSAHKDCVTLMLCGNAAGFLIKPGLIYRCPNPRALRYKNKDLLPVHWMYHPKAGTNQALTSSWFHQCFVPQAKEYLHQLGLPFKVLLILDHDDAHPLDLYHDGVQLEFLPANSSSLIQPLEQGITRTFKALYTRITFQHLVDAMEADPDVDPDSSEQHLTVEDHWRQFNMATCVSLIHSAIKEMNSYTMNACWSKLWPECVHNCQDLSVQDLELEAVDKTVSLARMLGGEGHDDLTAQEVHNLIDSHSEPLSQQDWMDLMQSSSQDDDDPANDELEEQGLTLERLMQIMRASKELQELIEAWDPYMVRALKVNAGITEAMQPYQGLLATLKKQRSQLSMTVFLKPLSDNAI